jgi:hypothetical protein
MATTGLGSMHNLADLYAQCLVDHSEIRLLKLAPSRSLTEPLKGELTNGQKLTTDLKYGALSYVWGPPSSEHFILLHDEFKLPITANCDAALRRLRLKYRTRSLWIDAICINQSCDDEKSNQVQQMDQVYVTADRVLVWLGEESDATFRGFKYLGQIALFLKIPLFRRLIDSVILKAPREGPHDSSSPDDYLATQLGLGINSAVRGPYAIRRNMIRQGLDSAWFERMWTLQELLMAQKCLVLRGSATISWFSLHGAFRYLQRSDHLTGLQLAEVVTFCDLWDDFHQDLHLSARKVVKRGTIDHML